MRKPFSSPLFRSSEALEAYLLAEHRLFRDYDDAS